jgi:hypothetical protein
MNDPELRAELLRAYVQQLPRRRWVDALCGCVIHRQDYGPVEGWTERGRALQLSPSTCRAYFVCKTRSTDDLNQRSPPSGSGTPSAFSRIAIRR